MSEIDREARARLLAAIESGEYHDEEARPTAWKGLKDPEHPNPLIGRLREVREVQTREYGIRRLALVEDGDGRRWEVWLSGRMIADQWAKADPSPGEVVAIADNGERETKDGRRTYRVLLVRVDRPAAPSSGTDSRWGSGAPS